MFYFLINAWPETLAQILLALRLLGRAGSVALPTKDDLLDLYFVAVVLVPDAASASRLCDGAILLVQSVDQELSVAEAAGVYALALVILRRGPHALMNGRRH